MNQEQEATTCPHGYPSQARAECPACKKLLEVYEDENYETLFRYENPEIPYDERREGVVSRKDLVGSWFTNNVDDLKTYIKARQPGGKIVAVRVLRSDLEQYDATKLQETKDMDIESGNYIISNELQTGTRMDIPLEVKTANPKKFLMKDWEQINQFVDSNMGRDQLLSRIRGS